MALSFERTILPQRVSPPVLPGALFSRSDSGKIQTRSTQRTGWTWEEEFFFKWDQAGRFFLSRLEFYFNQGTQLDVAHVGLTLLGSAGGTPLIDGADQTGSDIVTDGWPTSTNYVLRGGDFVTFAGIDQVYMIRADEHSDSGGHLSLTVLPLVFEGGEPAENAAVTVTDSVVFKAKIVALDIPEYGPEEYVAPRISFVEDP